MCIVFFFSFLLRLKEMSNNFMLVSYCLILLVTPVLNRLLFTVTLLSFNISSHLHLDPDVLAGTNRICSDLSN